MATTGNKTAQKSVTKAEQVQKSEPVSVYEKKEMESIRSSKLCLYHSW